MNKPLFYQNPVALDREQHRNLRINPSPDGFAFARDTNSIYLAGVEFGLAAHHYPIFFARVGETQCVPVALVGLRNNENLFVAEDGAWQADTYIPAFVRRYPFVPCDHGSDRLSVYFDETFRGFDADQGQRLFQDDGTPGDYLNNAMALLQDFQAQSRHTESFMQSLHGCGLLKEVRISIPMAGDIAFDGLLMIDEARLAALDAPQLALLHERGGLSLIYLHLFSLARLEHLRTLLTGRLHAQLSANLRTPEPEANPAATRKASRAAHRETAGEPS